MTILYLTVEEQVAIQLEDPSLLKHLEIYVHMPLDEGDKAYLVPEYAQDLLKEVEEVRKLCE